MADVPYTNDKRKCFLYVDDKGKWAGPFSAAQIVDQIKAGTITWMTPIWDQLREAGMIGAWLPAWRALGIPREPGDHDAWNMKPAADLTKIASRTRPETQ